VVALLKSVGASPKLTILIVGESLLNDGTAMVLFTIFYNSVNGRMYNVGSVFGFMFAAAFGSVALGIVIGLLTVRWLRSANRPLVETDVTIQIGITICSAYLTFFLAQNTLEISGVLACCGAGSMIAWLGPPIILNHESMHNVWGMMEWCLNTAIFLLAGLIIGNRILAHVRAVDWWYMLIFYVALMVIRFLTVFLLYPAISNIGHRCTVKEAVFMSWAGLRGALGMALALIVKNTCPDDIDVQTSRLFFYVGGIAALTLLLNATTAKALLIYLGLLNTDSPEKALVTAQIRRKLQRKTDKFVNEMAKEFEFTEEDVEEVRMSCTLLTTDMNPYALTARESEAIPSLLAMHTAINPVVISQSTGLNRPSENDDIDSSTVSSDVNSRVARTSRALSTSAVHRHQRHMSRLMSLHGRGPQAMIIEDLMPYVRSIFLEIVRVKYWHLIECGKLPRLSFSAQFLLYTIEVALDKTEREGAQDWACLKDELEFVPYSIRFLEYYQDVMPASWTSWSSNSLGFLRSRNEKREVYMLSAFIEAHEHAQNKIHSFLGLGDPARKDEETGEEMVDRVESSNTDTDLPCPEESVVIEESKRAVSNSINMYEIASLLIFICYMYRYQQQRQDWKQ
jgi:NhaP-type Na+/H+ or K+/H+ antiporter